MSAIASGTLASHAENFNRNIKLIARDLAKHFPNDAVVARLLKRINLASMLDGTALIMAIGPNLYKHRDRIYSNDPATEDFALSYAFDAEIGDAGAEAAETARHLVPLVQGHLRAVSAAEKKAYRETSQKLLDDYVEFLAISLASK